MRMLVSEELSRRGFDVATAADAAEAFRLFAEFDPDVLLTDIDLGSRPSGGELASALVALAPHLGVVFLSSFPRAAAGARAMGVPRSVFVSKQELGSSAQLVAAVEAALTSNRADAAADAGADDPLSALTRHQIETLAMVARGLSNDVIAEQTGTSVRAVERSVSRIFERLGISRDPALNPRVTAASLYLAAFGPTR